MTSAENGRSVIDQQQAVPRSGLEYVKGGGQIIRYYSFNDQSGKHNSAENDQFVID